jgi:hypothetical protein
VATNNDKGKTLESWIWDAACLIRGAKEALKYKEFILPLIFATPLRRFGRRAGSYREGRWVAGEGV